MAKWYTHHTQNVTTLVLRVQVPLYPSIDQLKSSSWVIYTIYVKSICMSLLIIGATGTLGRQVVRKALDEGFTVKCLVRNLGRAAFLKEWGAELVYGDLKIPDTIPPTMKGMTAIIDASTSRTVDQVYARKIELIGKLALIEAAQKAQIQRFVFFSILNADKYPEIPLMAWKHKIEEQLRQTQIKYTIFYMAGFFQGLITQYALPVLDKKNIWTTKDSTSIAYIDTLDAAHFCIRSLSIPSMENRTLPLLGNKSWNSFEIIEVCEKLSGQKAKVITIPIWFLKTLQYNMQLLEWTWNISERLAFSEILRRSEQLTISMDETYTVFRSSKKEIGSLDIYLQEYFSRIMKKLKSLNYNMNNQNMDINF